MRSSPIKQIVLAGVFATLSILSLAPAGASSANLSHSYHADTTIKSGSIVSIDPAKTDYVLPANSDNASRLLGVSIASNDSLLAVDPTEGLVQVAINGNVDTLVSNLNGDIKVGDQIAASPFNGVGMKAASGSHVIGLAQTAFNPATNGAVNQQITDKKGKTRQVSLGYVRISIDITNSNVADADAQLSGLQKLAKSITGHTISTARVIVSLIIAVVCLLALITLVYSSVYGGIISIGRNPLAKYAVFRTLGLVLSMVVLIASVSAFAIFLLLR